MGRICTKGSVGINVDVNPFEPHILASNLAHAIGHNLGFHHDKPDNVGLMSPSGVGGGVGGGRGECSCPDWHGCIMRSTVIGEEGIQPYKFSTCSKKQFQSWLSIPGGHAHCLLNRDE